MQLYSLVGINYDLAKKYAERPWLHFMIILNRACLLWSFILYRDHHYFPSYYKYITLQQEIVSNLSFCTSLTSTTKCFLSWSEQMSSPLYRHKSYNNDEWNTPTHILASSITSEYSKSLRMLFILSHTHSRSTCFLWSFWHRKSNRAFE